MKILRRVHSVSEIQWAFTAAALALGACGPKDTGPKYPDIQSFCMARASAECSTSVLEACAIPTANMSVCVAKRQQICLSSAQPLGTTYSSSGAEACVAQVSTAYADAKITLDESNAITAACLPVFDGASGLNAACQSDSSCKVSSGLRCVPSPGFNSGTCQVPQSVLGGGSCATSASLCVPGYHCGTSAHCDVDGALNETCASQPCGKDLQCSSAMVCVAKSDDGVACVSGAECLHGICNKANAAATGVCVSEVALAPNEPFCVESRT